MLVQWTPDRGFTGLLYRWREGSVTQTLRDIVEYFDKGNAHGIRIKGSTGPQHGPFNKQEAVDWLAERVLKNELAMPTEWKLVSEVRLDGETVKVLGAFTPHVPGFAQKVIVCPWKKEHQCGKQRLVDANALTTMTPMRPMDEPDASDGFGINLLHPANRESALGFLNAAKLAYSRDLPTGWKELCVDNTRAILRKTSGDLEIAFRGTQSLAELLADLKAWNAPVTAGEIFGSTVKVHQGFVEAYGGIRTKLLGEFEPRPSKIKLSGHSLGGALATLAAADFANAGYAVQLVTFGAPRVGGVAFREMFQRKVKDSARLVNRFDPVPGVPFGIEEAGEEVSFVRSLFRRGLYRNATHGLLACQDQLGIGEYQHITDCVELDENIASLQWWGAVCNKIHEKWQKFRQSNSSAASSIDSVLRTTSKEAWRDLLKDVVNDPVIQETMVPHALAVYERNLERAYMSFVTWTMELAMDPQMQALGKGVLEALGGLGGGSSLGVAGKEAGVAAAGSLTTAGGVAVAPFALVAASTVGTWYGLYKADQKLSRIDARLTAGIEQLSGSLQAMPDDICARIFAQDVRNDLQHYKACLRTVRDSILGGAQVEGSTVDRLSEYFHCFTDLVQSQCRGPQEGEVLPRNARKVLLGQLLDASCVGLRVITELKSQVGTHEERAGFKDRVLPQLRDDLLQALDSFAWHLVDAPGELGRCLPALPEAVRLLRQLGVEFYTHASPLPALECRDWGLAASHRAQRSGREASEAVALWFRNFATIAPASALRLRLIECYEMKGHEGSVLACAFLGDGRALSASGDLTLRVWDLDTGKAVRVLTGAWEVGTLHAWDVDTFEAVRVLSGHWGPVTACPWDPLSGHWGPVSACAVLPNARVLCASLDRTLRVWDLRTGEAVRLLSGHTDWVMACAELPEARALSASRDRSLRVWDLDSGKAVMVLKGHVDSVTACAALPNARALSASWDRTLRVWDLDTGRAVRVLKGHTESVMACAGLPGARALSASLDRTLRVWDLDTGKALRVLEGHAGGVRACAALPGTRALSGSDDGTLRVWDLSTGEARLPSASPREEGRRAPGTRCHPQPPTA